MKVGDTVRLSGDESSVQKTRMIVSLKSDARGVWIKLDKDMYPDMWHSASYYEVIQEC